MVAELLDICINTALGLIDRLTAVQLNFADPRVLPINVSVPHTPYILTAVRNLSKGVIDHERSKQLQEEYL